MGRHQRIHKKKEARRIARERMDILYSFAEREALAGAHADAKSHVSLMRKIGMRYNVSVPARYKTTTCRKCSALLVSGRNARVRLSGGRVRVECLECGQVRRYPYHLTRQTKDRRKSDAGREEGRGADNADDG